MTENEKKYFLDLAGLTKYDELIKEYIKNSSNNVALQAEIDRAEAAEQALIDSLAELANGAVKDNTDAIAVLNGTGEGSVSKQVSDAVAALVNNAPETLDTLKEIADWISSDTTASADLIAKVTALQDAVTDLQNKDIELKAYVDAQDEKLYDSIQSIAELNIKALFMEKVSLGAEETVNDAISNLEENQMLVLNEDSTVSEDITIPEGVVVDANGSTLSGNVTVSKGAIISNAVFAGKVTVE